jgi:YVTN family beta-propeller protein
MATEATRQVLASTIDSPGLSVVSSSRHPDSPRAGVIYDIAKLAAAVPVWFHPMNNGEYLVLFARRLTDAVPAPPLSPWPILYTAYTEADAPTWAIVSPATGSVRNIEPIPSRKNGGRVLTAGASRGEYLFVLNTYDPLIDGDENTALLQHFRVSPLQGITLMTEEMVPGGLSLGLYADKSHLMVFGDTGTGVLTAARKNWGRIGVNTDLNPSWSWQFHGGTGWVSGGFEQAKPLSGNMPAHGPCSLARYRDTYYLMASTQTDYTNSYTQTTAVGSDPQGMAVSPDGTRLYVANRASKSLTVIDTATDLVLGTVSVGDGPTAVAATDDFAYVLNAAEATVMIVNATTLKVTDTLSVGDNPTSITATPDGMELWVTVQSSNNIQIIDIDPDSGTKNTVVQSIPVGLAPQRVAFTADGTAAHVTNFGTNSMWVIDVAARTTLRTVATGTGPLGVCVTPDGDWVFVTNSTAGTISMIPTASYKPLPAIDVGDAPIEVAATDEFAYVVNQSNNTVSVISVVYRDEIATINLGGNPHGVVLRPDGQRAYVSNRSGAAISVIATATNSILPVPEGFNLPLPADVDAREQMNPFIEKLNALLFGVINGFIQLGTGVTYMITDLLDAAVSVITGTPLGDDDKGPVRELVDNFLNALTGIGEIISDPAAIFEQIIGALAGVPVVGNLVTLAQNFLQGTINTILNVTTAIIGPAPIALLEELIRAITDLLTPPDGGEEPEPSSVITTQVNDSIKLYPESSWKATTYTNKRVQDEWLKHSFEYDIAPTDRTFLSGVSLQDQLPLKPSFGSHVTNGKMTLLTEASEQTQVFTGSSPHLVVLPRTAKVVGTTIGPDGVITVPDTTGGTIRPMIRIEDASVTEGVFGPKQVRFRISLSAVAADTVTVRYTTSNQTATAGIDYLAVSDTVAFVPGVISQQITLTVYGDLSYEPDETFLVTLSDPVNSVLQEDPTATCTIVNDDQRTLVESLLEDLKNIINGIMSGAIQVGAAIVKAVATIFEQSVKTIVGVAVNGGELVLSMVDSFLNLVSGGLLDIGDYGTPAENLADIIAVLTNGVQGIGSAAVTFADEFLAGVTTTVTAVASGVVSIFQNIVSSVINIFPFSATPMLMSAGDVPALMTAEGEQADPVFYTPYVIHNQSTADIKVMAASRDKEITVKHGSGVIFTPYAAEPLSSHDWSWSYAVERAPRIVQGFPFLSTRKLVVNTYRLVVDGTPASGTFRLTHNGVVTASITYDPADASTTAENLRVALGTLESITLYEVVVVDATEFTVTLTNDTGALDVFSYRLTGGTDPAVQMTLTDATQSTYLTRWALLEPNPAPAVPSGITKAPVALPAATTATGLVLPDVLQQFVSVITTVVNGGLAVSTGVITTVTEIIDNAVALITGDTGDDDDGSITALVTEFMQNLAIGGGATQDAATSFENIIRQITGGTGLPEAEAAPSPLEFITATVDAAGQAGEDIFAALAELLQTLVSAITGR